MLESNDPLHPSTVPVFSPSSKRRLFPVGVCATLSFVKSVHDSLELVNLVASVFSKSCKYLMRFINIMYYVGKVFQATIEIIKLDIGFIYIIYNDFSYYTNLIE